MEAQSLTARVEPQRGRLKPVLPPRPVLARGSCLRAATEAATSNSKRRAVDPPCCPAGYDLLGSDLGARNGEELLSLPTHRLQIIPTVTHASGTDHQTNGAKLRTAPSAACGDSSPPTSRSPASSMSSSASTGCTRFGGHYL